MTHKRELDNAGLNIVMVLDAAAKLPGVRINRESYLRSALKRHCSDAQIQAAISGSPATAGVSVEVITELANAAIKYETSKVTGLSALSGIPGGLAMLGTVPVDFAQYVGHMLRIVQKLAYLYSWPDLFGNNAENLDDATESMLILFIGVMFGTQLAQGGVTKVANMIAGNVAKKLPQKALTKELLYPIVKRVASHLGVSMTKKIFATGVAKAIPVVGAVLSGGLTLGTFLPMCKRLQTHLASLELTKPDLRAEFCVPDDNFDGAAIDNSEQTDDPITSMGQ